MKEVNTMEERLYEVISKAIQEEGCVEAKRLTEVLIKNGIIAPPCKVRDTVYYLGGMNGKTVKTAKVESICFSDCGFGFELDANGYYFDMPANKVYFTEKSATEAAEKFH